MDHASRPQDNLIEKVSYTASLITDVRKVDPLLDVLRSITARAQSAGDLTKQDISKLTDLQTQLEEHLVKREKVRLFTPDSLKLQIQQHLQGENPYRRSKRLLQALIGAAIIIPLLTLLIPLDGTRQHILLVSTTAFSIVQLSAAWLFLSALKSFQTKVRQAFVILCTGLGLLGLSSLAQPMIEILGQHGNPYVSGAQVMPIVIAASLLYIGIYRYAILVGVRSRLISPWVWLGVGAAFSVFTWLGPHVPYSPEWLFDSITTAYSWLVVESLACMVILAKIWRTVPEVYKPPARTFFQASFAIILATGYLYIVRFWAGPSLVGLTASFGFVLLSFMGIMLMRAGYTFNKVSRY